MSLIRQIWLLLWGTLLLALVGGVAVNISATRDTLQTQLNIKNTDSANALALVLSQQKGDAQLMALVVASQFDTGYFQRIRLLGADQRPTLTREAVVLPLHAPAWFVAALPIQASAGLAQISDGWRALGAVEVTSHTAFAHDALWRGSLRAAAALLAIGVVAGLLAQALVARMRRPLDDTVDQAQRLVAGEFVTKPEPTAPELRRVTRAMNSMVGRLKLTFDAQASQLETLRQEATCDPLTGLANRKHFMGLLEVTLSREDGPTDSGLLLLRVLQLAAVNRQIGHAATDRMILAVTEVLQAYTQNVQGCHLGRLNGSDFALCLPAGGVALETARALAESLKVLLPRFGEGLGADIAVAIGAVEMQRLRPLSQVMSAADGALALAESRGAYAVELADQVGPSATLLGAQVWRQQIEAAIKSGEQVREQDSEKEGEQVGAKLARYPLINRVSELVHCECPLRLQLETGGPFEPAARWLPLALRSRLTAAVDERAVALALADIAQDGMARCINLSAASLSDSGFAARLRMQLMEAPRASRQLWLEVPEIAAVEHFDSVQELGRQLRPTGIRFGIEHAGPQLSKIDRLFEAGLDYAKLDASVIQGVAGDMQRMHFVRGMIVLLHGLAVQVFAEGVVDAADAKALWQCGVDGITGPWASQERADLVG
jgi:diguanylate cyclase (GGDEF)-like protein